MTKRQPMLSLKSYRVRIAEADHVVNLAPPMFANPAVATRVIGVDGWRDDVVVHVMRWSSVGVRERIHLWGNRNSYGHFTFKIFHECFLFDWA